MPGVFNGAALSSAEYYNAVGGYFVATGSMSTPRFLATATPLPEYRVLVAGGMNSGTAGPLDGGLDESRPVTGLEAVALGSKTVEHIARWARDPNRRAEDLRQFLAARRQARVADAQKFVDEHGGAGLEDLEKLMEQHRQSPTP